LLYIYLFNPDPTKQLGDRGTKSLSLELKSQ
jgi:hypothetical protein